jgi:hypothetical protein
MHYRLVRLKRGDDGGDPRDGPSIRRYVEGNKGRFEQRGGTRRSRR